MINISADITAPLPEVWAKWTDIIAVKHWSFASDDWAAEGIENDVTIGGDIAHVILQKMALWNLHLPGHTPLWNLKNS